MPDGATSTSSSERRPLESAGVGVVAIGRNEGERLAHCLRSALAATPHVVYVDSGSRDGSVATAEALGARVVELDAARPFTAARARNAGFDHLERAWPGLEYVQFVDGDCELRPGWIAAGREALRADASLAAVCGRRRERAPEASCYNRLADIEWDTPVGEADSFGGDVMIRAAVLRGLGGYDASLIAGEDPELARRVRRAGYRIRRLDAEMTLHDARLLSLRAWWRRQVRGGHAYAEAWAREGVRAAPSLGRRALSIAFWGGLLPACALLAAPATRGASLLLLLGHVALGARIYARARRRGLAAAEARLYALALVVGKGAELQGAALYLWNRLARRRATPLIEYGSQRGPREGSDRAGVAKG